ncbi:840_t:CDS:2, partial [Gigaspora rosea]
QPQANLETAKLTEMRNAKKLCHDDPMYTTEETAQESAPRQTYSQITARSRKYNQTDIEEIEQWTRGATEIRAQQAWDYFDIKAWHYDRIVKALKTKEGVE